MEVSGQIVSVNEENNMRLSSTRKNAVAVGSFSKETLCFWLVLIAVSSTFVGSVFGVSAGGIVLFPLRVATVVYLPFLFLYRIPQQSKITHFVSQILVSLLLYAFVSLLWSPDPMLGFRTVLIMFTGVILILMVIRHVRDEKALEKLMLIWSIAIIGTSLLGFYETYSGQYFFEVETTNPDATERIAKIIGWTSPRVFSGNWNNFAFTNAISSIVLLGWSFDVCGKPKIYARVGALFAFTLVFFSYSRAAILGMMVGLIVFALCIILSRASYVRAKSVFIVVIVLIIMLISTWDLVSEFVQQIKVIQVMVDKFSEGDTSIRAEYYSKAIGAVWDSYSFGRGLGASTEVIDGASYHSFALEILAELGVWIFFMLFIMFVRMGTLLVKSIRKQKYFYFSSALLASCFAFPILQVGPSGIWGEGIFWLWVGVMAVFVGLMSGSLKFSADGTKCIS